MKPAYTVIVFFLLIALEVISQTYLPAYSNKDVSAILYLLSGITIGCLPLFARPTNIDQVRKFKSSCLQTRWLLFICLAIAMLYFGSLIIRSQPLDYTFADMLPIIKIMGERWLVGTEVYAVIPEIWDGMQPIYLPVLWMAYIPALLAEVDIRWINVLAMILATGLILDVFNPRSWPIMRLLMILPLVLILSYVFIAYTTFISISEEPIVLTAYMFLAYALWKDKKGLIILALVCCILSRYALVFWAISWWFYELFQGDKKRAWYIAVTSLCLSLIILWISQGIYQLELFYSLKDAYLDSFTPDLAWRTSNTISKNIGLARFIPFEWLPQMHKLLFFGSLILPVVLYIVYYYRLRNRISPQLFALCSLKLCLVYFFNMNALPYSYLFYTSTFLSFFIFLAVTDKNLLKV